MTHDFTTLAGIMAAAEELNEAAEILEKYQEDQAATLEKEVADLAEQLKTKRAALRKAKKDGAK